MGEELSSIAEGFAKSIVGPRSQHIYGADGSFQLGGDMRRRSTFKIVEPDDLRIVLRETEYGGLDGRTNLVARCMLARRRGRVSQLGHE